MKSSTISKVADWVGVILVGAIAAIVTNTPTGFLEGTTFAIFQDTDLGGDALTVDGSGNVTFADARYRSANSDALFFGGFSGYTPELDFTIWEAPLGSTSFTPVPFEFSPALGVGVLGSLWAANKLRKHLTKK